LSIVLRHQREKILYALA